MFAEGSMVLVDKAGASCCIENLNVGDRVLNPLGGYQDRITRIERHVINTGGARKFRSALAPVLLRKQCISSVAPAQDTVLSHDQIVSVALKMQGSSISVVTQLEVAELDGHDIETAPYDESYVAYFSVALERGHQIAVNNLICNVAQQPAQPAAMPALGVAVSH